MMTDSEFAAVPESLLEYSQWVCWSERERDGKRTKVPIDPRTGEYASTSDGTTWTSFEEAVKHARETEPVAGIGFVFSPDDPIVGIDLDGCRDPDTGSPDELADDVVTRLDSYTEVSPSGEGYHVLVEGTLPPGRNRRGPIEMYDAGRFFTVTGDHIEGTPRRVAPRPDALDAIHREYVRDVEPEPDSVSSSGPERGSNADGLDDEILLRKARAAGNGEKFERLWNGDTSGYTSHSEADMALCFILAFWTNGDAKQIDRLFRRSELMRGKWDDVHYGDGSTYGEKTIERAITHTTEGYDPRGMSSGSRSEDTSSLSYEERFSQEKVRLLEFRVAEVEALLEQKNERIATLEATVNTLRTDEAGSGENATEDADIRRSTVLRRMFRIIHR